MDTDKQRDVFEQAIDDLQRLCPIHNKAMKGKRVEVKTGYYEVVRKIMYIGKCEEEGCNKWFEYTPGLFGTEMVMWP